MKAKLSEPCGAQAGLLRSPLPRTARCQDRLTPKPGRRHVPTARACRCSPRRCRCRGRVGARSRAWGKGLPAKTLPGAGSTQSWGAASPPLRWQRAARCLLAGRGEGEGRRRCRRSQHQVKFVARRHSGCADVSPGARPSGRSLDTLSIPQPLLPPGGPARLRLAPPSLRFPSLFPASRRLRSVPRSTAALGSHPATPPRGCHAPALTHAASAAASPRPRGSRREGRRPLARLGSFAPGELRTHVGTPGLLPAGGRGRPWAVLSTGAQHLPAVPPLPFPARSSPGAGRAAAAGPTKYINLLFLSALFPLFLSCFPSSCPVPPSPRSCPAACAAPRGRGASPVRPPGTRGWGAAAGRGQGAWAERGLQGEGSSMADGANPPAPGPTDQPAPSPTNQPAPGPTNQPAPGPINQPVPGPANQRAPGPTSSPPRGPGRAAPRAAAPTGPTAGGSSPLCSALPAARLSPFILFSFLTPFSSSPSSLPGHGATTGCWGGGGGDAEASNRSLRLPPGEQLS